MYKYTTKAATFFFSIILSSICVANPDASSAPPMSSGYWLSTLTNYSGKAVTVKTYMCIDQRKEDELKRREIATNQKCTVSNLVSQPTKIASTLTCLVSDAKAEYEVVHQGNFNSKFTSTTKLVGAVAKLEIGNRESSFERLGDCPPAIAVGQTLIIHESGTQAKYDRYASPSGK